MTDEVRNRVAYRYGEVDTCVMHLLDEPACKLDTICGLPAAEVFKALEGANGKGICPQTVRDGLQPCRLRPVRRRTRMAPPSSEGILLKERKGLGDVGVGIIFREVQIVWGEFVHFADKRTYLSAKKVNLGRDASALALSSLRSLEAALTFGRPLDMFVVRPLLVPSFSFAIDDWVN